MNLWRTVRQGAALKVFLSGSTEPQATLRHGVCNHLSRCECAGVHGSCQLCAESSFGQSLALNVCPSIVMLPSGQRTDQVAPGKAFASEFVLRVYPLGRLRHGVMTKSLDHEGIPENPWLSFS